jgi:hypothetical protein
VAESPANRDFERRLLEAAREKAGAVQHRVPQFYLRGFAGRGGKVQLFDPESGETELLPPSKVFAEEGYYTIRDEDDQPLALAEELYAHLEDKAARVHRRLLERRSPADLTEHERLDYAFFMAAQITRGETLRELDRRLAEMLGKRLLQMRAAQSAESWDRLQQELNAEHEDLPEVSLDQFRGFVERDEYEIRHSPEMTLKVSLSALPDLAVIYTDFTWHAVHFAEPCLFTSEDPVT